MKSVVEFSQVYKRYRKNMKSFKSIFGYLFNIPSDDDFWALANVSFKLKTGDVLGIIGENGAGKSTVLKILAKVTQSTKGIVTVDGKVGALIEIGAGLHPELTGRENIFLYGAILGMKKREVEEKYDDIARFSGLEDFLDTPVKFYSTGMYLRLGFSVTAHSSFDILLIDEVLAVGDEAFQKRCLEKISQFKTQGKTIIFVSHNLSVVKNICPNTIWLDKGRVKALGKTNTVLKKYLKSLEKKTHKLKIEKINKKVEFTKIQITGKDGYVKSNFEADETINVQLNYKNNSNIKIAVFGVAVYDLYGKRISGSSSKPVKLNNKSGNITLSLKNTSKTLGKIMLTFAISSTDQLIKYDWLEKQYEIQIGEDGGEKYENFTVDWI
jgi:ABC-type polysaccharide/polyol phosphate transport system ATPase subunit